MSQNALTTDFLLAQRINDQVFDNIPEALYPESRDDAYAIQHQLVAALVKQHGSSICGYKLACTNKASEQLLGVDGPFSGHLMSHSTYPDGTAFAAAEFHVRAVELEFVFSIQQDIPRSDLPYTGDSIKPFIGDFLPGIEIVNHRYADFTGVGANALICDNAIHGLSVIGTANSHWRHLDLSNHPVTLYINNKLFAQGAGERVLGNPLNSVAWIANHLQTQGTTLKAGSLITTGAACDIHQGIAGDQITADFGELGSVSTAFS